MPEPVSSAASPLEISAAALGDTQTNAYLLAAPTAPGRPCWIVDPGEAPQALIAAIERGELTPQAILLTHAHYDHIGGVDRIEQALGRLPILLHRAEAAWCEDPRLNLSAFRDRPVVCRAPDRLVEDGEVLDLAGTAWRVLHTPGHSPGSVCFVNDRDRIALVGDLIFAGSIGRTDFPTSDPEAMERSLERAIASLPADATLLPGHGGPTRLDLERRRNPFLQPGAWR
jgi:hydroxyacylglutathione hydrolase